MTRRMAEQLVKELTYPERTMTIGQATVGDEESYYIKVVDPECTTYIPHSVADRFQRRERPT